MWSELGGCLGPPGSRRPTACQWSVRSYPAPIDRPPPWGRLPPTLPGPPLSRRSFQLGSMATYRALFRSVKTTKEGVLIQCCGISYQCCGSEIIFCGSGFNLNFGPGSGSGLFMKNTFELQICRSSKHRNKADFFFNLNGFGSGLLMKNTHELQIIFKKIAKSRFFNLYIFSALYLLAGNRT